MVSSNRIYKDNKLYKSNDLSEKETSFELDFIKVNTKISNFNGLNNIVKNMISEGLVQ